jgi:SAM-dependent methyltransferase
MSHSEEVARGDRFAFGANWARFLALLDDERIRAAEQSLRDMLEVESLGGRSFVDVGSGSGLFSLAARRLGARVHSFDFDPQSVACTSELRRRYFPDDPQWVVEEGSALDPDYLERIGRFDIVYSWGVLHHTGDLWTALANVERLPGPEGRLFIAIYNDQGRASRYWLAIKKAYNRLPRGLRWIVVVPAIIRLRGPTMVRNLFQRGNTRRRGMDPWRDAMDWIGGLPFEVAKPEAIFDFYRRRGFALRRLKTCAGGIGCNEYVFDRSSGR